jgi:hypothetical protein
VNSNPTPALWLRILPWVVVVMLLLVRSRRPQQMTVARLWVWPAVLVPLLGVAIYATQSVDPAPVWEIVVTLVVGTIVGLPFGTLRGHHTRVRFSERPGVFYLDSSLVTMLVVIAAFALRYVVRSLAPPGQSLAAVLGDGSLGFAFGFIVASYATIYRKYQMLVAESVAAPSPPVESQPG